MDKYGINDSIIHEDFMIGSNDLNITGITVDGIEIRIFKNGNWA
ncbi:thermophilic metalloprotease family protein [[Clostridium] sordellii ATCC 9714]|nr:thermophilic metalloprotease family protein [[Clostridium] sordellii ATCC 9714] [Paeniclostridium sordellii ATCC 9714]